MENRGSILRDFIARKSLIAFGSAAKGFNSSSSKFEVPKVTLMILFSNKYFQFLSTVSLYR